MVTKAFEIRDRAKFIAAIAVKLSSTEPVDIWLMWKGGCHPRANETFVALIHLGRAEGYIDPYSWTDSRTMGNAHQFIAKNFDKLKTGDVIDVEFILGEVPFPKTTERELPAKAPVKVPLGKQSIDPYPND